VICPGYINAEMVAIDPRFEKYWLKLSAVERLTTGLRWAKVWSGSAMGVNRISSRRAAQDGWNSASGAVPDRKNPPNTAR
jgi:gluconolactonase